MENKATTANARLFLPSRSLGGCVFAGVERDTRGVLLSEAERFNYYPATPMAMISWIFDGTLHMVDKPGNDETAVLSHPLPRLVFSGPQHLPSTSWSPGPVHALSVGFYPEALGRLLGINIAAYIGQILPLEHVAKGEFLDTCTVFLDSEKGVEPFDRLQSLLEPFWQGLHSASAAPLLGDWIRSLATRVTFSTAGIGMRQIQRRIKGWTGQSHRNLQLFMRVEDALVRMEEHRRSGVLDLAGLANAAGFSDQSHMGRAVRRVTGLSPARFDELIATEEAFWFYRLIQGHLHKI